MPSKKQQAELVAMTDPAALKALAVRLVTANTWGELLAGG